MKLVKNRITHLFIAIVVVIVIILFLVFWSSGDKSKKQAPMAMQQPPATIAASTVKRVPLTHSYSFVGTLKSEQAVKITSEIAGKVESLHFHSGQIVNKGDLLITLKHEKAKAAVEEAKSEYQGILDQYDCRIEATSEGIGQGARFTIYIPVSDITG